MSNFKVSQTNGESHFRASERSESTLKQTRKKERAADAAKTARLRGLRLAKEAAEKLAIENAAPQAGKGAKRAKSPSQPKPRVTRLVY